MTRLEKSTSGWPPDFGPFEFPTRAGFGLERTSTSQATHSVPTLGTAQQERQVLCRNWLLFVMTSTQEEAETKDALCVEAMKVCNISRSEFESCWSEAIVRRNSPAWRFVWPSDRAFTQSPPRPWSQNDAQKRDRVIQNYLVFDIG